MFTRFHADAVNEVILKCLVHMNNMFKITKWQTGDI